MWLELVWNGFKFYIRVYVIYIWEECIYFDIMEFYFGYIVKSFGFCEVFGGIGFGFDCKVKKGGKDKGNRYIEMDVKFV